MKQEAGKGKRLMAILIAAAFLLTGVPLTAFSLKAAGSGHTDLSGEEMQIAGDISNTTGVDVEKILLMKKQGKTWNEILEKLKNSRSAGNKGSKDERSTLLAQSGSEDKELEKLKKEGFTVEEITDAKLYAERIGFDLNEIQSALQTQTQLSSDKAGSVKTDAAQDAEEEDALYIKLAEKFDTKFVLGFLLRLEKNFGSAEKVMDEYLFTLQTDLDLQEYLTDNSGYLKKRDEQSAGLDQQKVITVQKLEQKMLESIQRVNQLNFKDAASDSRTGAGSGGNGAPEDATVKAADKGTGIPDTPDGTARSSATDTSGSLNTPADVGGSVIPSGILPENGMKSVRPQNPADAMRQEVEALNPGMN
jgi:hypothetical protein